jgi:hypothetical protein
MTLGPDRSICATELREAMRKQLDTLSPPAGANVDAPLVRPNFDALGEAVWLILTRDAETVSGDAQDHAFWQFLADLRTEVEQLRAFAAGVRGAFEAWSPAAPATNVNLRTTIVGLTAPSASPAAPTSLRGAIR